MFPNHYVSTTCGCECSGGLELKNGLTVEPNTPVEILQRANKLFFKFKFNPFLPNIRTHIPHTIL